MTSCEPSRRSCLPDTGEMYRAGANGKTSRAAFTKDNCYPAVHTHSLEWCTGSYFVKSYTKNIQYCAKYSRPREWKNYSLWTFIKEIKCRKFYSLLKKIKSARSAHIKNTLTTLNELHKFEYLMKYYARDRWRLPTISPWEAHVTSLAERTCEMEKNKHFKQSSYSLVFQAHWVRQEYDPTVLTISASAD